MSFVFHVKIFFMQDKGKIKFRIWNMKVTFSFHIFIGNQRDNTKQLIRKTLAKFSILLSFLYQYQLYHIMLLLWNFCNVVYNDNGISYQPISEYFLFSNYSFLMQLIQHNKTDFGWRPSLSFDCLLFTIVNIPTHKL